MVDITADATVYPSANDIAEIEKEGRFATEQSHVDYVQKWMKNHVVSGFVLPASDPDLTISVPSGTAIIDGHRVVISTATAVLLIANQTNHIFLAIGLDINNRIDSVDMISNTTGTPPVSSVKIGEAVTDATTVTGTTDLRDFGTYNDEAVFGPALNIHLGGALLADTAFTGLDTDIGAPIAISRKDLAGRDTKVLIHLSGYLDNSAAAGELFITIKDGATLLQNVFINIPATSATAGKIPFSLHAESVLLGNVSHSIKMTGRNFFGGTSATARNMRIDVVAIGKG